MLGSRLPVCACTWSPCTGTCMHTRTGTRDARCPTIPCIYPTSFKTRGPLHLPRHFLSWLTPPHPQTVRPVAFGFLSWTPVGLRLQPPPWGRTSLRWATEAWLAGLFLDVSTLRLSRSKAVHVTSRSEKSKTGIKVDLLVPKFSRTRHRGEEQHTEAHCAHPPRRSCFSFSKDNWPKQNAEERLGLPFTR